MHLGRLIVFDSITDEVIDEHEVHTPVIPEDPFSIDFSEQEFSPYSMSLIKSSTQDKNLKVYFIPSAELKNKQGLPEEACIELLIVLEQKENGC